MTMWIIVLILSSASVAAKADLQPGHGVLAGYCTSSDQCAADECCISFDQPPGKRAIVTADLPPELLKLVTGKCHKLAADNETCYVPGGFMPSSPGLWYDCPCEENFYCASIGMANCAKGEIGRCAPKIKTRALREPCASGADCADDMCCVNNYQPGGKRQLLHPHGHCFPMGMQGSYCYVRDGSSAKPTNMVFSCPCALGLTCAGSGTFDAQFGETGTCT